MRQPPWIHQNFTVGDMKPRPRQFCGVPGCGKSFDRPAKLAEHARTHTGEKPFNCSTCSKAFTMKKHLHVHELSHLDAKDKPFVCEICGIGHVSKQHHTRHMKVHEPKGEHSCDLCGKTFVQLKSFQTHYEKHEVCDKPGCNKVCRDKNHLIDHTNKYHSQRYHCGLCSGKYNTADELRQHTKDSHKPEPKPVRIPQPSETVAFITGLDYEVRPLGCPYTCGKRFTRKYDLDRHLNTHRDPLPEAKMV